MMASKKTIPLKDLSDLARPNRREENHFGFLGTIIADFSAARAFKGPARIRPRPAAGM